MTRSLVFGVILGLFSLSAQAQIDEEQLGAWYMFLWNKPAAVGSTIGFQGDIQHRNWDMGGDNQQFLVRGAVTWSPENSRVQYVAGYTNFSSRPFGHANTSVREHRLYEDAVINQGLGEKLLVTHRFRLEHRNIENQDFGNQALYMLLMNYPLNSSSLTLGTWYLNFSDEIMFKLEQDIGNGRSVDYFDRNLAAAGFGSSSLIQFNYMYDRQPNLWKGQIQLALFHNFQAMRGLEIHLLASRAEPA